MTKGFMILYPPGTGKTRTVWRWIFQGKGNGHLAGYLRSKIANTLIAGPNRGIELVWLRELALQCLDDSPYKKEILKGFGSKKHINEKWQRKSSPKRIVENAIRDASASKLKKKLGKIFQLPAFRTYNQLSRIKSKYNCQILILDEWHRAGNALKKQADDNIGCFKKLKISKAVFFVSATPLNPVLHEKETDSNIDEKPLTQAEVEQRINQELARAITLLGAFCKGELKHRRTFLESVRSMHLGILKHKRKFTWKPPVNKDMKPMGVNQNLERYLLSHPATEWTQEYALCNGLIRTSQNKSIGHQRGKKRCFGFEYKELYAVRHPKDARNWIIESDKFRMLQCSLEANRVVKNSVMSQNGKKALIFCIHQGVAHGLAEALKRNYGKDVISDALRKSSKGREELIKKFNTENSELRILIVTDVLSESVDLHHACKLMIHYELPWSPLRLFQRVGRLTRIHPKTHEMNKSVRVEHIIVPGSVEEERVNRLIRRIGYLKEQALLPKGKGRTFSTRSFVKGLLGDGPSLHYREWMGYKP